MRDVKLNGAGGREAKRAVGERSAAVTGGAARVGSPDPELIERARRRRFSAEYKLGILKEAEACTQTGEIGALLRREGLYTSHLSVWRKQRDEGALTALGRSRGRRKPHPLEVENATLRRRAERAETELAKARKVIEVQGNVSALLGELLEPRGAMPDESSER
jgi:transposase-like protein